MPPLNIRFFLFALRGSVRVLNCSVRSRFFQRERGQRTRWRAYLAFSLVLCFARGFVFRFNFPGASVVFAGRRFQIRISPPEALRSARVFCSSRCLLMKKNSSSSWFVCSLASLPCWLIWLRFSVPLFTFRFSSLGVANLSHHHRFSYFLVILPDRARRWFLVCRSGSSCWFQLSRQEVSCSGIFFAWARRSGYPKSSPPLASRSAIPCPLQHRPRSILHHFPARRFVSRDRVSVSPICFAASSVYRIVNVTHFWKYSLDIIFIFS